LYAEASIQALHVQGANPSHVVFGGKQLNKSLHMRTLHAYALLSCKHSLSLLCATAAAESAIPESSTAWCHSSSGGKWFQQH
jgi:hypothetical protein